MNNKTAEEMKHVFLREIPKAREAFGEAVGGSEDWFIAEACEKAANDYFVSPLKKRIEELEAGLREMKSIFNMQPGDFTHTCEFIDKLLNPSTNGKQD